MERREPTDGELIERVADGDGHAFEELYRRYVRAVLGLAVRRIGDRGRAEDAAQEAFVAIWRSAHTFDRRRGAGAPWLYAVARNAITDGLRRTPPATSELQDGPAGDPDPSDRAESAWTAWRVHRALEVLPEHERPLIELAYWRGPQPERDRRVARYTPRNGEDANPQRTRTARRRARRRALVSERGPDFDELVGADIGPAERERLLRVHDLLVTAGPPPELSAGVAHPPAAEAVPLAPRRRRGALVALAAAFGVLAFAARPRGGRGHRSTGDVGGDLDDRDARGRGRERVARGLRRRRGGQLADGAPRQRPFDRGGQSRLELWLTLSGEPLALCGSFLVDDDGAAVVPMNAPYRLTDFDGWVVVEEGSTTPLLTT